MKQRIRLTENELRHFINESVRAILNESRNNFITIELPSNVADNEDVINTIRQAMEQIGYEYYNNAPGGYNNDTWIYRYAPSQPPTEYYMK